MVIFNELGKYGRIGNQMFQIASTIGIAIKSGHDYGFPYWKNYDHLTRFKSDEDIDIQGWFSNSLPGVTTGNYTNFNIRWGYRDLTVPDWSNLMGHMQSEKYFLHCESVIRHYFEFYKKLPKLENTIALHLRAMDYGDDYHPICKAEYYHKALDMMPDYNVLVFSDEPKKAKQVIGGDYTYVEGNHSMHDLNLISCCDYHIIANSTFSWWGAWLADSKKVIAPSVWFGSRAKLETKDIYPQNWIVI